MQLKQVIALAGLSSTALAVTCTDGAVVFAVRGSDGNWNSLANDPAYNQLPSGMTAVANDVIAKAGSGYLMPIMYPSINPSQENLSNGNYQRSVAIGTNNLQQAILSYVNACPNGKIFVEGYSQGAQVVSGALGGCTPGWCSYGPIKAHNRIMAAIVFADPGFVNHIEPIDAKANSATQNGASGTVTNNGAQYAYLNKYFSTRFRSYCQAGDAFCNSGYGVSSDQAGAIHGNEPETYQSAAIGFFNAFF